MKMNRMFDGDRPEEKPAVKTTIVGGRPPGAGKAVGPIPKGLEVLVKKASVDPDFREHLLSDGPRAARSIGLTLTDSELAILRSLPPSALTPIIDAATVPPKHRAAFLGKVAAAMLLALGVTVLPGCDPGPGPVKGIRPRDEQKIEQQEKEQDGDQGDGGQAAKPTEKPVAAPDEPPIEDPVCKGIRPDIPPPKTEKAPEKKEEKKKEPPRTRGIRPDRPTRERTEKE